MYDDNLDFDFNAFLIHMGKATESLRAMNEAQNNMRWQFGETPEYKAFVEELDEARLGWVSSHC
jgi:hypothetical protein